MPTVGIGLAEETDAPLVLPPAHQRTLGLPRGTTRWAATVPTLTPAAWYRLNEATSATTALDSSGNNRTFTRGATTLTQVAGLLNGDADFATSFPGTVASYIHIASATWFNLGNFSASAIISKAAAPAADQHIWSRVATDLTNHRMFAVAINSAGRARLDIYNTAGTVFSVTSAASICDGKPHLIVVRRTAAVGQLYVDGVSQGTVTTTGTVAGTSVGIPMGIGFNQRNNVNHFEGVIDEAVFWGSALTDPQLTTLHDNYFAYGETDASLGVRYTRTFPIGLASETSLASPLTEVHAISLGLAQDEGLVQPITMLRPLNGGFANRDDISNENGDIPITNLTLSNTEAGEYTNGLVATLWYIYTAADVPPSAVVWSFDWAGQSAGGGAGIRVYSDDNDPNVPTVGELLDFDDTDGAAGTVELSFSPVALTTYYLQIGVQEKAGTTSHLSQLNLLAAPPTFTAVIP